MRIAISNAARNYGGQEAVAALLATELQRRGHDVLFLCRSVFPALQQLHPAVRVEAVLPATDLDPRGIWRARRALRAHCSQVLLATTNKDMRSAALAAALLAVPVVVRRAMARPLRASAHYRYLYGRLPAHIVVNSQATLRIMLGSAPWIDPARTSVIYNGIDPAPLAGAEPADLGLPPGALAVGFVGRLVEWKGVMELAAAWPVVERALPDAHLVVAGEGEMEGAMREVLRAAQRVHWLGFRSDVPAVMRALDVVAYPSVMEGFGLAAVEAMAAGLPVVCARAGALPELLDDGVQGRLVPPRDPAALVQALIQLGRDPALRRRMGLAGRERVRKCFSLPRMVDAYEALLARVEER